MLFTFAWLFKMLYGMGSDQRFVGEVLGLRCGNFQVSPDECQGLLWFSLMMSLVRFGVNGFLAAKSCRTDWGGNVGGDGESGN